MIFGITLKHFAKLVAQGDDAKCSERLLLKTSKKKFKTNKLEELTYSEFVDVERFFEDSNYYEFCRIFVNKFCWETIYIHNLPIILEDYAAQKLALKDKYHYIFNPPSYGEPQKETIGSELRKEFVEEFGNWVILMDVVCKGRVSDYKSVEQWKTEEFLFWANYLSGQKIIENIK